jgi:hypothetical protein
VLDGSYTTLRCRLVSGSAGDGRGVGWCGVVTACTAGVGVASVLAGSFRNNVGPGNALAPGGRAPLGVVSLSTRHDCRVCVCKHSKHLRRRRVWAQNVERLDAVHVR